MPGNRSRVHVDNKNAPILLQTIIYNQIVSLGYRPGQELVVLCVGTDRSTGDALGPLTGTFLKKTGSTLSAYVMGDIDKPVHASNLDDSIDFIRENYTNSFIIAVDAGLGKKNSVGYIDVKKGPLKPGTGVNKELTRIGDMHITGLVNVGGYMEYLVLQSTRLSLVLNMAEIIASAIEKSVSALTRDLSIID